MKLSRFGYLPPLLAVFAVSAALAAAPEADRIVASTNLKHAWIKQECTAAKCTLMSSYKPMPPFKADTEAMLTLEIDPRDANTPAKLDDLMQQEIANIRQSLPIVSYVEDDGHKPVDNIAWWEEKLGGHYAGFIKYRAGDGSILPYTVIHGIVLGKDNVEFVHLITFFAQHQDEVRQDQRALLEKLPE